MKIKIPGFLFLQVLLIGSLVTAQPGADSTKILLNEFLDQWHRDAAAGNLTAYTGDMSSYGVYIGTDATEYWTRDEFEAFCKPYFEQKKTWTFVPLNRTIYLSTEGNTAWFDELLNTQMGICRGSGVLQQYNGTWKIEHYVLSATIPNPLMQEVIRLKAPSDSSFLIGSVFDRFGMDGTFILFDPALNQYSGYHPALWDSGYLPASTFKIPNTLIGLDCGAIDTTVVFPWDGAPRRLSDWNRDLNLREAFRVSCVPCYQELARRIGTDRMLEYLSRLNYGQMEVTPETIDLFWLEGNSRVTPREQVDFLRRLREESLPLKSSAMHAVKAIMQNEKTPDYKLYGKTGWAFRNGNNYGWFVGWVETADRILYVATLIEPKNQEEIRDFQLARKGITLEVLRLLNIIRE